MEEDCVANGLRGGTLRRGGAGFTVSWRHFSAKMNESSSSVGDSSGKMDRMEGEGVQKPLEKERREKGGCRLLVETVFRGWAEGKEEECEEK